MVAAELPALALAHISVEAVSGRAGAEQAELCKQCILLLFHMSWQQASRPALIMAGLQPVLAPLLECEAVAHTWNHVVHVLATLAFTVGRQPGRLRCLLPAHIAGLVQGLRRSLAGGGRAQQAGSSSGRAGELPAVLIVEVLLELAINDDFKAMIVEQGAGDLPAAICRRSVRLPRRLSCPTDLSLTSLRHTTHSPAAHRRHRVGWPDHRPASRRPNQPTADPPSGGTRGACRPYSLFCVCCRGLQSNL